MTERRTMTLRWDRLGEDDDDCFFESCDRISSFAPHDLASSGSDDDENYDDSRMSFASAAPTPPEEFRCFVAAAARPPPAPMTQDYDFWMAEPGSIKDRRKRLLEGMGLSGDKELLRVTTIEVKNDPSIEGGQTQPAQSAESASAPEKEEVKQEAPASASRPPVVARSRSYGSITSALSIANSRREEFVSGALMKQLLRSPSELSSLCNENSQLDAGSTTLSTEKEGIGASENCNGLTSSLSIKRSDDSDVVIKNLDTEKEFIVNEVDSEGVVNTVSERETGKQLTRDEFEKSVGFSPIVKELMRRENVSKIIGSSISAIEKKMSPNAILSKSFRSSKKKGAALLKNIKGVANSMTGLIGEKDKDSLMEPRSPKSSSGWTKVRQNGKSFKELTGLYMCQEIQAHQGSIWTLRFSFDTRYLASAGEDRVIHVWEVMECDVLSLKPQEEGSSTPLHPMANSSPDRPPVAENQPTPSEKKKKGRTPANKKGGSAEPDYVLMPETSFLLSEKPVCSFQGHLDDVLDLSWSKSQQLLSSSMDKTVRLWDIESKTCLKLFAHNDYVTCIQFNPVDDKYFISGSLDAKVRIWNIPARQVVDWTDLHEMVTAACYTPDGQGALVGSHTGSCRLYDTSESEVNEREVILFPSKSILAF
uniref:WD repeat-containing protein 44-like n=1 Tax=Nelumbo nucifera TaxID=4432 RepID=A0A822XZC9_NELNU|nr:TPA_asm: hypothetical protein HUJ06_025820 [Nelumbo nucifera]